MKRKSSRAINDLAKRRLLVLTWINRRKPIIVEVTTKLGDYPHPAPNCHDNVSNVVQMVSPDCHVAVEGARCR